MPYINQEQRPKFDKILSMLPAQESAGELNYVITKIIQQYIVDHKKRYETLNAVVGVMECAKLELYRKIVAIYENEKISSNGDVLLEDLK